MDKNLADSVMKETEDLMFNKKSWVYDVKCRKCGKITRMHFSTHNQTNKSEFTKWVVEHSTYPISKQCGCDNGMMMLHDIVSYGDLLDL